MKLTSRQYRMALRGTLSVLTRFDLMGLEPGLPDGAPADEYSPEAADLVRLMATTGALDIDDVRRVWLHWFEEDLKQLPNDVANDLVRSLNEEFARATAE